jgi:protein DGCR14
MGKMTPWNKLSGDNDDSDMPEFGGYNLVPESPSINPSSLSTPLMTWGDIEGTPLLMTGSETPGPNSFRLPQPSRREQLGHKLSERASKNYRNRSAASQAGKVTKAGLTPRFGSGIMSPAAQHLLRKSDQRTPSFNDALRASYGSVTPGHYTPRSQATPTPLFRAGATPSSSIPMKKR